MTTLSVSQVITPESTIRSKVVGREPRASLLHGSRAPLVATRPLTTSRSSQGQGHLRCDPLGESPTPHNRINHKDLPSLPDFLNFHSPPAILEIGDTISITVNVGGKQMDT